MNPEASRPQQGKSSSVWEGQSPLPKHHQAWRVSGRQGLRIRLWGEGDPSTEQLGEVKPASGAGACVGRV